MTVGVNFESERVDASASVRRPSFVCFHPRRQRRLHRRYRSHRHAPRSTNEEGGVGRTIDCTVFGAHTPVRSRCAAASRPLPGDAHDSANELSCLTPRWVPFDAQDIYSPHNLVNCHGRTRRRMRITRAGGDAWLLRQREKLVCRVLQPRSSPSLPSCSQIAGLIEKRANELAPELGVEDVTAHQSEPQHSFCDAPPSLNSRMAAHARATEPPTQPTAGEDADKDDATQADARHAPTNTEPTQPWVRATRRHSSNSWRSNFLLRWPSPPLPLKLSTPPCSCALSAPCAHWHGSHALTRDPHMHWLPDGRKHERGWVKLGKPPCPQCGNPTPQWRGCSTRGHGAKCRASPERKRLSAAGGPTRVAMWQTRLRSSSMAQ